MLRKVPVGARYLIGVSGGRDSVALLHWLQTQGYRLLVVCHLDHGLRRRASKADARFVEKIAARAELPFESKTEDIETRALRSKCSIESAARTARLEFFAEIGRRRRCSSIFLGHHADDLVETYLFHLLRGSGTAGQGSIRPVSVMDVDGFKLTLVRPLLEVWREDIDSYMRAHRLRCREDASNSSLEPTRNRIRHRILPMIEKQLGRNVRKSLWRAAEIAAEEHAMLEEMLPADLKEADTLPVKALQQLAIASQRRVLRGWLQTHAVADVGFKLIENLRALLDPASGPAKVNLPGDRHARRRTGELFLE